MIPKGVLTVAAVLAFAALPAQAQTDTQPASTGPAADVETDTGEVAAMLGAIERADRDTALRSRVVEAKGQNAGGLGNVTAHVEVAGGVQPVVNEASVSGSASVETGKD